MTSNDVTLTVAFDHDHQLWAAQLQMTGDKSPVKLVGRSHRDAEHPMRRDSLLTVAIISALSNIPIRRYEIAKEYAQKSGAQLPRLLLSAHELYVTRFQGGSLHVGGRMGDVLRRVTSQYEITFDPIPGGMNGTAVALRKFAVRTLVHALDEGEVPAIYRPDVMSVIEHHAHSAVPSVVQPAPLTPAYGY